VAIAFALAEPMRKKMPPCSSRHPEDAPFRRSVPHISMRTRCATVLINLWALRF